MRRKLALVVALVMILTSINLVPLSAFAATTSVNPGSGTLASAISAASGGDTLTLTDGVYYVPSTINLSKAVTIQAASGTHPVILGGEQVTGWSQYSGNIYCTAYSDDVTALVENGQAGKIATSATYTASSASGNTINGTVPSGLTANKAKVISYGHTDSNWQSSTNVITSSSSNSLTFSGSAFRGLSAGTKYEIINDKVVIDEPGEFAYDGSYLYYYPYNAANLETAVGVGTLSNIFNVRTAGNLTLSGVDVAGASSTFGSDGQLTSDPAIKVAGNATIDSCRFYAIDTNAIGVTGSKAVTISHSSFSGIGGSAVNVSGSNVTISNNTITDTGVYAYGTISIGGHDVTVANNTISNSPVRGINASAANDGNNGYNLVIEYNDVSNCNTKVSDTGLVYFYKMDGATSSRRNTIRYNAFHDSVTYNSMGFGIYLDDDADYTDVYGNWVYNLSADTASGGYVMGPLMIKGTGSNIHDNVIANNAVTTNPSNQSNNAAIVVQELSGNTTTANTVERNIIYNNNAGNAWIWRVMDDSSPFASVDYNVYGDNPGSNSAGYFSASGNLNSKSAWIGAGRDTNSLWGVNPQFTDAANGDFTIGNSAITTTYYNNPLTKSMIGATGTPDPNATMAPVTAAPATAEPATAAPSGNAVKLGFDMSMGWLNNANGTASVSGTTLTMTKDKSGSPLQYVFYYDPMSNDTSDQDYTIHFTAIAESTRGYANNWDSFSVGFLRKSDWNQNGFVAIDSDGSNTAQRLYNGYAGSDMATLTQEEHDYSIVTNRGTGKYSVYVDGNLVVDNASFDMNGAENNYFISVTNGNSDATNASFTLKNLELYQGVYVIAPVATAAPTAEPATPAPGEPVKIRDVDVTNNNNPYINGNNGTVECVDGVLHMTKDVAGSNFNVILWSNSTEETLTDTATFEFDAKVSGGYGHSWDGYAVALRYANSADHEVLRLVPVSGGVAITKGAGAETIGTVQGTGYHAYSVVYDRANATVSVYVDGTLVIDGASMTVENANLQGFMIKNGHNDATGCELLLGDADTWHGEHIRSAATTDVVITEAPTAVPTEVPAGYVHYYKDIIDFEDGVVDADVSTVTSYWMQTGDNTFTVQEVGNTKVGQLYRPTESTVQMDLPAGSGLDDVTKFVYEFDLSTNNADSEWKFMTDCNYTNTMQWVINRNGDVQVAGTSTGFVMANNTTYQFAWVLDFANGTQDLYVDGVAIATGAAIQGGATNVRALKLFNTIGQWGAQELYMNFDNISVYEYDLDHITRNAPEPTEVPTEAPTPAPGEPVKIRDISATPGYDNQLGGGSYMVTDGVLHATKSGAGAFSVIYWSDSEDARTEETTLAFDAKVSGGLGHSWDGYAVSLRTDSGDTELIRLVATNDGVAITRGAGAETIATVQGTGYHAYSVVYDKANDTLNVYVDGTAVISDAVLGFTGQTQHGFMLKSGHNDATGAELYLGAIETWTNEYIRQTPTIVEVTEEPTEAPTAVPAGTPVKIRDISATPGYDNQLGGGSYTVTDGVIHATKSGKGAFSVIYWADTEDARNEKTTIVFDAKVSGGIPGNNWDGYALSLYRTDYGDRELVRLVPTATGVDITRGAGAETIATIQGTGYHAYSCVYDKANDTLEVYADGTKVIDTTLNFTGKTQHGFILKSGHNDATGCELYMGEIQTWTNEYVRNAPSLVYVTPEPTAAPTAVPVDHNMKYTVDSNATVANSQLHANHSATVSGNDAEGDAVDGDISIYNWSSGYRDHMAAGGQVTATFNLTLPSDNDGMVYFGAYDSGGSHKSYIVGFAPNHDGTYTVVTNKGGGTSTANEVETTIQNNSTGATVNGEVSIPVYVVFTGDDYDVLINGRYSHSGSITEFDVADMWCLAWFSRWAGETDTLLSLDDFNLYTDFALVEDTSTEAPTEAPTQAPSGATVTGTIAIDTTKYTVTAKVKPAGANDDQYVAADITVAANGEYTITLPAAGNYTIVIDAETMVDYSFPVTEQDGTAIEGPSITPILGDYNNDGNITSYDVGQVMGKLAASGANFNAFMDFNNDTNITSYDVGQIMGKVGASY